MKGYSVSDLFIMLLSMNCIIIHGCGDAEEQYLSLEERSFDKHRMPWLVSTLTTAGIPTQKPAMPNSRAPDYDAYKKVMDTYSIDENSILIGHSCGAAFLVRRLQDTKKYINHLILVAPWKIADEDNDIKRNFYEYPIDTSVKERIAHVTIFTSDDEEEDGKKSAQIFHDALRGNLIELLEHGHYTLGDMGTEEFPEIVAEIMKYKIT